MKNLKSGIYRIIIIMLIIIFSNGCKESDTNENESNDGELISLLTSYDKYSNFTSLIKAYVNDSIIDRSVTLFIPSNENFNPQEYTEYDLNRIAHYHIITGFIIPDIPFGVFDYNLNDSSKLRILDTSLDKYAYLKGTPADLYFNGIKITNSEIHNTTNFSYVIYEIESVSIPKNNLLEEVELNYPYIYEYIELADTIVPDSIIIGIDPLGNTVYDTTSATKNMNTIYDPFFPFETETRDDSATVVLYTESQFSELLEYIVTKTSYESKTDIPNKWIIKTLIPYIFSQSVFKGRVDYENFNDNLSNINGVITNITKSHINKNSKKECSNGIIYEYSELNIPDSLFISIKE